MFISTDVITGSYIKLAEKKRGEGEGEMGEKEKKEERITPIGNYSDFGGVVPLTLGHAHTSAPLI